MRRTESVQIETERLLLRMPKRGDETGLARFYGTNRDYLQPYSPSFADELFSARAWRDRIDRTVAEYRGGKGLRLILLPKGETTKVIGVANFTSITGFPTYLCNLGYSIAESEQKKGLMTEALQAAITYVFHEMGLHRIEANYMPRNVASGRVLEKLGFVIEGHAKDYILINGKWEDHVRASRTHENWI